MERVFVFSSKNFEKQTFEKWLQPNHRWTFSEIALTAQSANLAKGFSTVCCFVSDKLNRECLEKLRDSGTKLVALRSAGFNHVDLEAAKEFGIAVCRVPKYSPEAVAEFTVGIYLCLNRKIFRAHDRVHDGNFSLEGLVGQNICKQTIGVVGTGNIGKSVAQIFRGFGAKILAHDLIPDLPWAEKNKVTYVDFETLLKGSDVISLHAPLTPETKHLIDAKAFEKMKTDAFLVNTSRGALVDTASLIHALKSRKLSGAALDVYEEEENIFFKDHSGDVVDDDQLAVLRSFPNVLITSHQAFLTEEALDEIAKTTIENISSWTKGIAKNNL